MLEIALTWPQTKRPTDVLIPSNYQISRQRHVDTQFTQISGSTTNGNPRDYAIMKLEEFQGKTETVSCRSSNPSRITQFLHIAYSPVEIVFVFPFIAWSCSFQSEKILHCTPKKPAPRLRDLCI